MDKNSAIGMTLIAVVLILYFNYFSPSPDGALPPPANAPAADTAAAEINTGRAPYPSEGVAPPAEQNISADSALPARKDLFSLLEAGEEQRMTLENEDIKIVFSSRGGVPEQVRLKRFTSHDEQPLYLIKDGSSAFSLLSRHNDEQIDLYRLRYAMEVRRQGDTTLLACTAQSNDGARIEQLYTLPPTGYKMGYSVSARGARLTGETLSFRWDNRALLQEQHMEGSRKKTTVNYYTTEGDFDGLPEIAEDKETETLVEPLKWVAIRQKFFASALIAEKSFKGGEISSWVDPADAHTVKHTRTTLFVPMTEIRDGTAGFHYFFGPLKYDLLDDVAPGFAHNLSLGWPPIIWVNRFLIIPIFKLLERFIDNYGLIIIVLVLIVKLILSPLSYRSYLSMAKMRLLKPELDLIKEKHGDDMAAVQQEQLKLYRQAGVNPFSGCVPMLLQMPILFAMFYFFPVSIELRQAGFLWADDLSTYDSILELPFTIPFYGNHVSLFVLLMTASTLIYTWQNNQISAAQGPMRSISYVMPVVFMFVLNSFSAGLSFYYFVSNLVTFAQQAIIRKFVDEEKIKTIMDAHRKKILSSGGTRSRFMNKLQEAMKASEERRRKQKK